MPIIPLLAALAMTGQATPQIPVIAPPASLPSVNEAARRAAAVAATAAMAGEIVVADADGRMADVFPVFPSASARGRTRSGSSGSGDR